MHDQPIILDRVGRSVVDFAPHRMTALLEQHAHRWQGFEDSDVRAWFRAARLSPEEPVLLDGDPLTVAIWAARLPANDAAPGPDSNADADAAAGAGGRAIP